MKDQNRVTALAVVTPKTTALCVPQAPTSWNWSKPAAAAVAVGPLQGETPKAKKTARAGNPFHNLRLNKDYPHAEVTFTIEKGIEAKATFNFTEHPGRLSRGTVALLDPDTGYLMQKDAESKAHDFATAVKADLIVIAPTGKVPNPQF